MKKIMLALLALVLSASAAQRMVVGYYPYWAQYSQFYPKDVRFQLVTHLHYGYMVPSADGSLALADESDQSNFEELLKLAQEHKVQVLVSIGGMGNEEAMKTAAGSSAQALADNALALVRKYKLAGVELDWKFSDPSDMQAFATLAKAFSETFANASEEPLLAATLNANLADTYTSEVLDLFDYLMVGSLDEMNAELGSVQPNSNGAKLLQSLKTLKNKGVEAASLLPVLPLYGKSFAAASGLGSSHKGIGSGNEGLLSYKDLMGKFKDDTYKVSFDETTLSEVAVSSDETIVFNGIPSVKAVAKAAMEEGYGGMGLYDISNDMPEPIISLFVTAGQQLRPKVDYKKKK